MSYLLNVGLAKIGWLENLVLVLIITLSFFHSLAPELEFILYALTFMMALKTFYLQICGKISWRHLPAKSFLLLLVLLQYTTVNGLFNCCSLINFKRIIRLTMAVILYYIFAFHESKKKLPQLLTMTISVLGVIIFVISTSAFFNQRLWSQTWRYLLKDEGLYFQMAEKSRGRLPQVSPLDMGALLPLGLLIIARNRNQRILGLISFLMFLSLIILWNYRSHAISLFIGILTFFMLYRHFYHPAKRKTQPPRLLLLTWLIILTTISSLLFAETTLGINLIGRFMLKNDIDLNAAYARIDLIREVAELFKKHPIVGIGMGNFTQYSRPSELSLLNLVGEVVGKLPTTVVIIPESHNLVAEFFLESGVLGTMIIMFIIWQMLKLDIRLIKTYHSPSRLAIVISSWIFLISSLMDSYSKSSLYTFFIMRGILININD